MIVPIEALRVGVGLDADDASEDVSLTQLEAQAARWVEEKLSRRFQSPEQKVEYLKGTGTSTLFLWGTVEDETAGAVVIRERALDGGAWEAITDPEDVFEIRRGLRVTKLVRMDGSLWLRGMEYEVTFDDGYETAPDDIQALVIEAVKKQRDVLLSGSAVAAGEGVIKSETIGDYSYTLDLSAAAVVFASSSLNADFSADTINRWRRVYG